MKTRSIGKKINTPRKTTLYVPFPVFFAFVLAGIGLFGASKLLPRGALWGLLRPSGVFWGLL